MSNLEGITVTMPEEMARLRALIAEGEKGPFLDGDVFFDQTEAQIQRDIEILRVLHGSRDARDISGDIP